MGFSNSIGNSSGGTLWYAIGIYMIGVAVVLYFRPRAMFRENGMWKEFGLATTEEQTVFPFWMFAIVWAILSYALANLISIFFATVALQSVEGPVQGPMNANAPNSSFIQPITQQAQAQAQAQPVFPTMAPMAPMTPMAPTSVGTRAPGYYILDPYANPAQPRYIYYGMEPPGFSSGSSSQ